MSKQKVLSKRKKLSIFDVINTGFLILLALMTVFPFLQTLLTSFASYEDVVTAKLIVIPWDFNFDSYHYIFAANVILKPSLISTIITVGGTLFQLLMTMIGAYVLSSRTLPFRTGIMSAIIFTMFFGGGLIPFVLIVQSLGMLNSYFALVLPFSINSFNLILLRNFIRGLPYEVLEAAKIDGASEMRILFQVIIPLSIPAEMTIGLYYFVGLWNDWYWPMIFLEDAHKYPLALALRSLIINSSSDLEIQGGYNNLEYLDSKSKEAAVVMISILPMIAVFPFVQKFFVKGIVLGAVKG